MTPTIYAEDVKEGTQLTREVEMEYVTKAKTDPNYEALVVKAFIRLVYRIAKEYERDHIDSNDLVAEGITGVKEAIKRFKPELKKRFSTYARWWIKAKIGEFYREFNRGFEISGAISSKLGKIINATEDLEKVLDRRPTPAELGKYLDYKEGYVNFLLKYLVASKPLHVLVDEANQNSKLETLLADNHCDSPSERLVRTDAVDVVRKAILNLTDNEKYVITKRYGLDNGGEKTLSEVGKGLKLTAERVRQIQNEAEKKLRKAINK